MTYRFFINGEERLPTPEEQSFLLSQMLRCLGYEPDVQAHGKKRPDSGAAAQSKD